MNEAIPITMLSDISITRLDNVPLTILDDIQSEMGPNELVNTVVVIESIDRDIPNIISGSYKGTPAYPNS